MEAKLTPDQLDIVKQYREIHSEIAQLESSIQKFSLRIEALNQQLEDLRITEKKLEK